jgi:bifunctional UDP-N-acetylglucosamine pyrophosphorylase/glucosamine-1-phosphate N-acetyltransferase
MPLATIILAAGQGTRMKSDRAKVLHEIGGEPLVSYPIRLALELGSGPIVLVVGHQKDAVRAKTELAFGAKVRFAEQLEQKGTGHAVMEGIRLLQDHTGKVLLLYGDVPLLTRATLERLQRLADDKRQKLAIITTVLDDPTGYGRIVRDTAGRVRKVIEQKDASDAERVIREINAGIYLADADFLRSALSKLTNKNAQGEYYLTDIVGIAIGEGHEVGTVIVDDQSEVLGCNTRAELATLDAIIRKRTLERLMKEGVTIVDPQTTYVSVRAKIDRDTVIHPGVHIRGDTEIGRDSVIDAGSVITSCKIGAGVEVKPYSVLENATVQKSAIIGPFSRLRPGASVLEGAHVGNFVELKNTELGKGAKANHLAYLGDATIGEGANVGAGTITCNYDGYGKYRTEIGANAFIGSNATLVAPVEIKKDAYVAAGSTITDAVGPSDLAFGRAKQVNKEGRATQIRKEAEERAAKSKKK